MEEDHSGDGGRPQQRWDDEANTQGLRQGGNIAAESPGPSSLQPEPGQTQVQQLPEGLAGNKLPGQKP